MSTPPRRMRALRIRPTHTPREDHVLGRYLQEIGTHALLTATEEEHWATLAAAGDAQAREKLVRANLRFVVSVAKQYQHRSLPLTDLIGEGNIGLLKAAERFDPTRGFKFISYASWWVRQRILQALSEQGDTVRLPKKQWQLRHQLRQLENSAAMQDDRAMSVADQARHLGVAVITLQALLHAPLGRSACTGSDAGEPVELLADDTSPGTDDRAEASARRTLLTTALHRLTPVQQQVVRLLFGLHGGEALSLRTIAPIVGLSAERVRQIKEEAFLRLRMSHHLSSAFNTLP